MAFVLPTLIIEKENDTKINPGHSAHSALLKNQLGNDIGVSFIHKKTYWVHVKNIALFSYKQNGTHMRAFPSQDCAHRVIRETFEKIVLPLVIQGQGREALHGSALLSPQGVIAFCADSGTGKSTLAAYISHKKGWPIWADDIVIVDSLAPQAVSMWIPFKVDLSDESKSVSQFSDDLVLSVESGFQYAPLARIFELKRVPSLRQGSHSCTQFQPAEALQKLLHYATYFGIFDMSDKKRLIGNYIRIVESVPVSRLTYPAGFENLDGIIDTLIEISYGT